MKRDDVKPTGAAQGAKRKTRGATIVFDPNPKDEWKAIGGADRDEWNSRQGTLVIEALASRRNKDAATGVISGMTDMKPADPLEGMLIGQMIAAHEAAMNFYRLGWLHIGEYFEAGTKYLQLADRAGRTLAMLSERLDHHRGRGRQQIVVKHVTVNADQAMVADSIVTGKTNDVVSVAKLLPANIDQPMPSIEPSQKEAAPVEGGGTKSK
jgi:hypothetical protein